MTDKRYVVRVDNIKWFITTSIDGALLAFPLCPDDNLQLDPIPSDRRVPDHFDGHFRLTRSTESRKLKCEQCGRTYEIPRNYEDEQRYVIRRTQAKVYSNMTTFDLDGELTPIAKTKVKDDDHFVVAQLMDSRRGKQEGTTNNRHKER